MPAKDKEAIERALKVGQILLFAVLKIVDNFECNCIWTDDGAEVESFCPRCIAKKAYEQARVYLPK